MYVIIYRCTPTLKAGISSQKVVLRLMKEIFVQTEFIPFARYIRKCVFAVNEYGRTIFFLAITKMATAYPIV